MSICTFLFGFPLLFLSSAHALMGVQCTRVLCLVLSPCTVSIPSHRGDPEEAQSGTCYLPLGGVLLSSSKPTQYLGANKWNTYHFRPQSKSTVHSSADSRPSFSSLSEEIWNHDEGS